MGVKPLWNFWTSLIRVHFTTPSITEIKYIPTTRKLNGTEVLFNHSGK